MHYFFRETLHNSKKKAMAFQKKKGKSIWLRDNYLNLFNRDSFHVFKGIDRGYLILKNLIF